MEFPSGTLGSMKWKHDGYNWIVRVEKGELLVEQLTKLVKNEQIKGAWVSALGAAQWAELGFYDLDDKKYIWKRMDHLMEITSLQGNVSWVDGEPALHMHASFSDREMRAFGGHIKELQAGGTVEVLLHHWYDQDGLKRSPDPETGLNMLDL